MGRSHLWTTPDEVVAQVLKIWERGEILTSFVSGTAVFPRRLRFRVPSANDLRDHFAAVRDWIQETMSIPCCRVELRSFRHGVLGHNSVPQEIWIDSAEEAVKLIKKEQETQRFLHMVEVTRRVEPLLLPWIERYPIRALAYSHNWDQFLTIATWLRDHPRPGLYLRQIDLPGIHSKFVEGHRGILAELFDIILPANAIDSEANGADQFERRYGFFEKPLRIRFRPLDSTVKIICGANSPDLMLDVDSFARLTPSVSRVFITENEINYLSFPPIPDSLVIFGAGYGFERLRGIEWLKQCSIHYWGDIDTHGFAILDQLRGLLGGVQSFLMDRQSLLRFKSQWGIEERQALHELTHLNPEEQSLYDDLRFNRIRPNLRLEQERIGFHWVEEALHPLCLTSERA